MEHELDAVTDNPLCFPTTARSSPAATSTASRWPSRWISWPSPWPSWPRSASGAPTCLLDDRETGPDRLPPFLTPDPGLNSGYMVAQYTAAALVAENAVLAAPAGVHSLPTCAGMEDFVSMGATSANKLRVVLRNAQRVVAIELLCASAGLEFRRPLRAGAGVERGLAAVRALVPPLVHDRILQPEIEAIAEAVRAGSFAI